MDDQEPISRRNRPRKITETLQTPQIIQKTNEQISKRTKSKTFEQKYTTTSHSKELATQLLTHTENSVLEKETGKQLNYGQLRKQPILQETWNKSFSNEMGRLCQGVGKGPNGKGKIIEGTNTFFAKKLGTSQNTD